MRAIANCQPYFNHAFRGHGNALQNPFTGSGLSITETNRSNLIDRKSADIDLVTAEGDKVTISLDSLYEESYSSYNSRGYTNGMITQTQMQTFHSLSNREMSITVEGDLNQEELADIQQVLGKIESLANDFFSGEIDEAVAQAVQFDDMGSIVNLQANLDHSYGMSVEQQYMAQTMNTPEEPPEAIIKDTNSITGDSVRTLVDEMTRAVGESKVKPEKMAKALPKFIDRLFDKHLVEDDPHGPKRGLAKFIKSKFFDALPEEMRPGRWGDKDDPEEIKESEETGQDTYKEGDLSTPEIQI